MNNKLEEIASSLIFSNILLKAQGYTKVSVTDVDVLIHKDGKLLAAFEMKSRCDAYYKDFIPLNASQYITLKDVKAKLGLKNFYYLIFLPKGRFIVLPIRDDWIIEEMGEGAARAKYAIAPIGEAQVQRGF